MGMFTIHSSPIDTDTDDICLQDNLELSDDSDIEVHPNVDKKSFIRAKQAQIHQNRAQRKHQIITLKYERIINDGMIERIDRLLTALKSHKPEASPSTGADELVFQALIESAGDPKDDQPLPPPEGVHQNVKDQPHYSKMIAVLVDQVRGEIKDDKESVNEFEAWIKGVTVHKDRIVDLNKELEIKLKELEAEEKKHITSDDYQTGFSYSSVCPASIRRLPWQHANVIIYRQTKKLTLLLPHHRRKRKRNQNPQSQNSSILHDLKSSQSTRHNQQAQMQM